MDRSRFIREITGKGIAVGEGVLKVVKELGRGGNGIAFQCLDSHGRFIVAKVYIPPDNRDMDERSLSRFEREIKLSTTLQHPNVIRALASGTLKIGAYTLPFYTMPLAPRTLRGVMHAWKDPDALNRIFRVFLKAARGVVFLHSNGVVHRDLKPENVLIAGDDAPWIADLGIAHVNPQFVSGSLKTIEKEHLLNRDYYAPEQRFGSAVEVDERADIYALGCIMYELILGTPPVRNNSPALSSRDEALVYLEPVFNKMTAYSASERYERLEDALDDLGIAFGYVLATIRGGRAVANRDLPTMIKLLRSSNEMHRNRGIEIAKELGKEAVESLHSLLGHARREVRNAAALALGEITDPDSLRYLVAAMYGQSKKAHAFRPSADTASTAIARYPAELRLHACEEISQPVPAPQVLQILHGLPEGDGYTTFSELAARGVILLDSTESELGFLAEIDEDKTWPLILVLVRDQKGWEWNWKLRSILGHLSPLRQAELIKLWLPNVEDSWHFKQIFDSLRGSSIPVDIKSECLNLLLLCIESFGRRFEDKYSMAEAVKKELAQLNSDGETAEIF